MATNRQQAQRTQQDQQQHSTVFDKMSLEDFQAWAEGLRESHVRCRDLGHRWRTLSVEWVEQDRMYHRTLRCSECSTARTQLFGYDGTLLSNNYAYAEGYQAPAGVGRLDASDRGQLRLVSLKRVLTKQQSKAS